MAATESETATEREGEALETCSKHGLANNIRHIIRSTKRAEACTLNSDRKNKMDVLHRLISIEQELGEILTTIEQEGEA